MKIIKVAIDDETWARMMRDEYVQGSLHLNKETGVKQVHIGDKLLYDGTV